MKERVLKWMACPVCEGELTLAVNVAHGLEVIEGVLACSCYEIFPIIRGVPRMISGDLQKNLRTRYSEYFSRHPDLSEIAEGRENDPVTKKKETVIDRFGYEWTQFSDYDCDNLARFIAPLPSGFFRGKIGLDIGCGAGRYASLISDQGAEVIAVDISQAVDAAYKNNAGREYVHVVQADVCHLPFRPASFHFIYSLGVLHHLPNQELGYRGLIRFLATGGSIFIWLYAYSLRKVALESLRFVAQKLSNDNIRRMAYLCNLVDYGIFVNLYRRLAHLPGFGNRVGRLAPLRVKEYARHGFHVSYADWFDRLSAPITNYYREDEMRQWLARSGLCNTRLLPEGNSWWWLYGERGGQA
jgi:SAM-dependent methyltransferase